MIIYKATNTINNKSYIGQTTKSLNIRKRSHELKGSYFHNALMKYGKNNFIWNIIYECKTKKDLDEKEIYYIKHYKTKEPNGYNLTDGGTMGTYGLKRPDMIGAKNISHRPDVKEKQRKYMLSDKNPARRPDVRKKISDSLMGDKNPRYGKPSACGFKGKKHTTDTKLKMGKSQQKYTYSFTSPENVVFNFTHLKTFCEEQGLVLSSVKASLNKHRSYKGWTGSKELKE